MKKFISIILTATFLIISSFSVNAFAQEQTRTEKWIQNYTDYEFEAKITNKLNPSQKEELKCRFGQTMPLMGKREAFLMVNIEDGKDLWFGGEKLDGGAYLSVSLLGNSTSENYVKMTDAICTILEEVLSIDPKGVYVTYHPVSDWGWNRNNF